MNTVNFATSNKKIKNDKKLIQGCRFIITVQAFIG
jgi:hypothetical protein